MGIAENKALVLRFSDEVWDKGPVDVADQVFRDDFVLRRQHLPVPGRQGGRGLESP